MVKNAIPCNISLDIAEKQLRKSIPPLLLLLHVGAEIDSVKMLQIWHKNASLFLEKQD